MTRVPFRVEAMTPEGDRDWARFWRKPTVQEQLNVLFDLARDAHWPIDETYTEEDIEHIGRYDV